MYDEERKMRFLDEEGRAPVYWGSAFKTTAPYEEAAGLDLCELPLQVLQTMLDREFGARSISAKTAIVNIRLYIKWCDSKGYPVCHDIDSVEIRMDQKMRRFMVASPQHLQSILDGVFRPVDSESIDCLYRCYLWMAFAGLGESDAVSVKTSEIDFVNMTIEYGGRSYELYREAAPAFHMACEATEFVYDHPSYTQRRSRYTGECLMRGIRTAQVKVSTVTASIYKVFHDNGIETNFGRLRRSGIFYRAYEAERMGYPANFDDEIAARMEHIRGDYRNSTEKKQAAAHELHDLLADYNYWKGAFAATS